MKLSKDLKKRMETELRQYWYNIKKLEQLEADIISESVSSDGIGKSNFTSDPTSQKALKIMSTRSIIFLHERILYVTKVIEQLTPFERDVFTKIFKENRSWQYMESYNVSRSTYYNIMNKCIKLLAKEWGEV